MRFLCAWFESTSTAVVHSRRPPAPPARAATAAVAATRLAPIAHRHCRTQVSRVRCVAGGADS
eukprot:365995-Chlamydomonas_euryale.AAC.8